MEGGQGEAVDIDDPEKRSASLKMKVKAVKARYLSAFEKKPTEEEKRAKEEEARREKMETRQFGLWDSVTTGKVLPKLFQVRGKALAVGS